jgi:general secretion pathway protein I
MRAERGFTLLEVLIAFAIAALALAVLFRAASGGLLSVEASGHYEEAVARARSHLTAIGRDAGLVAGTTEGDDGGGYRWHLVVTPVATGQTHAIGTIAGAPPPILYAIVVSITWRDAGKDRQFVLRSERMGLSDGQ